MSEAFREIGPAAKPRGEVHRLAREVAALAALAAELTMPGPRCNVPRAEAKLAMIQVLLGGGQ